MTTVYYGPHPVRRLAFMIALAASLTLQAGLSLADTVPSRPQSEPLGRHVELCNAARTMEANQRAACDAFALFIARHRSDHLPVTVTIDDLRGDRAFWLGLPADTRAALRDFDSFQITAADFNQHILTQDRPTVVSPHTVHPKPELVASSQ